MRPRKRRLFVEWVLPAAFALLWALAAVWLVSR